MPIERLIYTNLLVETLTVNHKTGKEIWTIWAWIADFRLIVIYFLKLLLCVERYDNNGILQLSNLSWQLFILEEG